MRPAKSKLPGAEGGRPFPTGRIYRLALMEVNLRRVKRRHVYRTILVQVDKAARNYTGIFQRRALGIVAKTVATTCTDGVLWSSRVTEITPLLLLHIIRCYLV